MEEYTYNLFKDYRNLVNHLYNNLVNQNHIDGELKNLAKNYQSELLYIMSNNFDIDKNYEIQMSELVYKMRFVEFNSLDIDIVF